MGTGRATRSKRAASRVCWAGPLFQLERRSFHWCKQLLILPRWDTVLVGSKEELCIKTSLGHVKGLRHFAAQKQDAGVSWGHEDSQDTVGAGQPGSMGRTQQPVGLVGWELVQAV